MYQIALCDDNREFLECLKWGVEGYCRERGIGALVYSFCGSDALVETIEEKKYYDAYILDIDMPGCSGLSAARMIRECTDYPVIIFVTVHSMYAIDAYELDVFRYLIKEHLGTRFKAVMDSLFCRLEKQEEKKYYLISNQRKYIRLLQQDILYVYKKQKNAVFVLTEKREEWERVTLSNVLARMNNPDMKLLDRSYIVNLSHIRELYDNIVVMDNGEELQTGIRHVKELKQTLSDYWGSRL